MNVFSITSPRQLPPDFEELLPLAADAVESEGKVIQVPVARALAKRLRASGTRPLSLASPCTCDPAAIDGCESCRELESLTPADLRTMRTTDVLRLAGVLVDCSRPRYVLKPGARAALRRRLEGVAAVLS